MNIKVFTAILVTFFITACSSIPEDHHSGEQDNSVEREDEILRQRLTIKKQPSKNIEPEEETTLNDSVIEEDLIINTTLKSIDKDSQKSKVENSAKDAETDDEDLDDEIDHDAIDIDYRKKKTSSDKNSDNK